jgi:hypothetical protein
MNQKIMHLADCIVVCTLIFGMALISFNCIKSPLSPIAPSSDVPLSFPITDLTYVFSDFMKGGVIPVLHAVIDSTMPRQIPKELTSSMKNGTINIAFTNGIPLAMSSSIGFLGVNDSTGKRDTLVSFNSLGPIAAAHAAIDRYADSSVVSNVKIYLTEDQVAKINKSDSLAIRLEFSTAGIGTIVIIRDSDEIRVQASANATYIVNKP